MISTVPVKAEIVFDTSDELRIFRTDADTDRLAFQKPAWSRVYVERSAAIEQAARRCRGPLDDHSWSTRVARPYHPRLGDIVVI